MMQSEVFLSLIIPAHNEEMRLPETLDKVVEFLGYQAYSSEIIVVENGSRDHTIEVVKAYADRYPQIRLICETERGKGLAVRRGMLNARGAYRIMCDADLSMPITELNRFLPPFIDKFDIIIASREAPGAVRYNEPIYRHLGGRVINTLVRWFVVPSLQDTQCGFKCFRAGVAQDLFSRQMLTGVSFDIEVLFLARKMGYKIMEQPIPWFFNSDSRVRFFSDTFQFLIDIAQIHFNARQGKYNKNCKELEIV